MTQPGSQQNFEKSLCNRLDEPAQRAAHAAHDALWNDAYGADRTGQKPAFPAKIDHPAGSLPIAMPWNASGVPVTDYHIVFGDASRFGLTWNDGQFKGMATGFTETSVERGRALKAKTDAEDPGVKEMLEIRYRDAPPNWLPENSPWWQRDSKGQAEDGYKGQNTVFKKLDFENSQFQDHIVEQAKAAIKSGAVDGIMLDWYKPGVGGPAQDAARLQLIEKLRAAIGPNALIIINTNNASAPPDVTKRVNGYYMECTKSTTSEDMQTIEKSLDYGEKNTMSPHINILETWPDPGHGRDQLPKMRATAALLLIHAPDGALLFADPDGSKDGDHAHDFYAFYNTVIGKPVSGLIERPDGSEEREFQDGTVVYNPIGNPKQVDMRFRANRKEASTEAVGREFVVPPGDGEIFTHIVGDGP